MQRCVAKCYSKVQLKYCRVQSQSCTFHNLLRCKGLQRQSGCSSRAAGCSFCTAPIFVECLAGELAMPATLGRIGPPRAVLSSRGNRFPVPGKPGVGITFLPSPISKCISQTTPLTPPYRFNTLDNMQILSFCVYHLTHKMRI